MKQVQVLEVALSELHDGRFVQLVNCLAGEEDCQAIAQVLSEVLHVDLVVEELALLFGTRLVRELPPANSISRSNHARAEQVEGAAHNDRQSGLTHDLIEHSRVRFELEIALFRDLGEPAEHRASGHLVVSEQEVAIIDTIVAQLGPNISNLDPWEGLVRLTIPDLNDEWLHTVVLFERDAASEDHSMIRLEAESSRPKLGGLDCRAVDRELLCLWIVRGRRFQAGDIRAMA